MPRNGHVVQELPDLPQTGTSRLRVRVILSGERDKAALDIREFIESSVFRGWTRRGVRLDAQAFSALLRQARAIQRALKDGGSHKQKRKERSMKPNRTTHPRPAAA